jgi:hypothetical protein
LVALAFQAPSACATSAGPALELIARRNPTLAALPNDRGVVYSASRLRNTVRRRFHDTLAKVEYAYDYGMPKWLAPYDRLLKPFRPERALLGFQKFCHFRIWYRDQLRDYVLDVLRDSRTRSRSYYDVKILDTMAQSHFKGVGNFTSDLHRILTMELVERKLLAAKN